MGVIKLFRSFSSYDNNKNYDNVSLVNESLPNPKKTV